MRSQELTKIGLSEKEAAVYLALLELGSDTVQNIAKKANVNRATTYVILDSLSKKGVVSIVEKKKKTYFTAESPEALARLIHLEEADLKERIRILEALMSQLRGIYNAAENKPIVRFYEGKEGLKTMHAEFLRSPDSGMDLIYSRDHVDKVFSNEERLQLGEKRREQGKKVQVIYTYTKQELAQHEEGRVRRKIPEDLFPLSCDIAISGNRIRIASLGKVLSGIIIEDEEIARTLHSLFSLAWEGSEKYQK